MSLNREDALKWCVDNIEDWNEAYTEEPDGWEWAHSDTLDEWFLITVTSESSIVREKDWRGAK
jgi:hypothetical protein